MLMLTRLLANKAFRRAVLIVGLSVGAAVWGIPPEVVDTIVTALSN